MNSSHPGRLNEQIYSEAADWLIEFRSGDVDATARKALYDWLCTSPEHMRAYLELAAIWSEGSRLDTTHRFEDEEVFRLASSDSNVISLTDLSWKDSLQPSTDVRSQPITTEPYAEAQAAGSPLTLTRPAQRTRYLAIAACALVAILGAWLYSARNTYSTGIGEQRSLALADGSTVDLDANSKVRVRFTANRRTIELVEGQALFHVAKDPARVFVVQSNDTKVRAVGTVFDVYRRVDATTVTVIEGRVAVLAAASQADQISGTALPPNEESTSDRGPQRGARNKKTPQAIPDTTSIHSGDAEPSRRNGFDGNAQEFLLGAGEQAILTAQATVKPKEPDIAAATAWTQRRLIFQSARLAEVALEFNRYNTRQLVIKDKGLEDFHITGVFASTNPDMLLRFLASRPGIIVTAKDNEIFITRGATEK